jgi:hypothetical protein
MTKLNTFIKQYSKLLMVITLLLVIGLIYKIYSNNNLNTKDTKKIIELTSDKIEIYKKDIFSYENTKSVVAKEKWVVAKPAGQYNGIALVQLIEKDKYPVSFDMVYYDKDDVKQITQSAAGYLGTFDEAVEFVSQTDYESIPSFEKPKEEGGKIANFTKLILSESRERDRKDSLRTQSILTACKGLYSTTTLGEYGSILSILLIPDSNFDITNITSTTTLTFEEYKNCWNVSDPSGKNFDNYYSGIDDNGLDRKTYIDIIKKHLDLYNIKVKENIEKAKSNTTQSTNP